MNRILSLTLTHFRNHDAFVLEPNGRSVILAGPNGAGKTNILEAVSLLSPGKGLRKAKLREMVAAVIPADAGIHLPSTIAVGKMDPGLRRDDGVTADDVWTIAAQCDGLQGEAQIGTGLDGESVVERRLVRIDGKNCSQMTLANHLAIVWQTPQMDGIFLGSGTDRRAFLDRLVYGFDSKHATRVNAYEKAMRDRNRVLAGELHDIGWLNALEARMAAEGVAIAAARNDTLARLNAAMQAAQTSFPKARLMIDGPVELALNDRMRPADAEAVFAQELAENRRRDERAGRALAGVHRSVLSAYHLGKEREAAHCSTGEQKAVLLAILLAHARARADWLGAAPILLLDEVVAHLDAQRRRELFGEIEALGAQAWLTGTDAADFSAAGEEMVRVAM